MGYTEILDGIGANAASGIVGMGIGHLTDQMAQGQANKNMKRNIAGSKEMTDYNTKKALEVWDKTNYKGQIEQMERAGLNTGLMYGGSGGSGGTVASTGGSAQASGETNAVTGMGMMLQTQNLQAQRELIEEQKENLRAERPNIAQDTLKKEAETANVRQVTEQVKAEIERVMQDTAVKIEQEKGLQYDNELKERTMEANVDKTRAEVNAITEGVAQKWQGLSNEGKKLAIDQFKAELEAQYPATDKVSGKIINEIIMELSRKLNITNYEEHKRKVK